VPTQKMTSRWRPAKLVAITAAGLLTLATAAACSSSGSSTSSTPAAAGKTSSAPAGGAITQFPRDQTLYTSGTLYGAPSTWNPFNLGNYTTGAQGLIYEPLFLYDPSKGAYKPWLAASGTWDAANKVYTIKVRDNVKWSNGQPLTGADVAWSINSAATNTANPYNSNAGSVDKATASGNTVTVTFKGTPAYAAWDSYLWKAPVVSQAEFSKVPATQVATWADTKPIGTGPMTLLTYNATETAYQVKPDWWGSAQLGLNFKFKYLVDVVNGSNNVELGALTSGQVDWSNNFLPNINQLIKGIGGYGFKTYYPNAPYMMPANTAWLEFNTTKAPFNNVNFRKAMAYAIDPDHVVNNVYGGLVQKANPTGLLPNQSQYIDQGVVSQYGFTYDPAKAKQFLAQSGYKGQQITLQVPNGWTDWMAAINTLAQDLKAVGINVQTITPEYPARTTNLTTGNYDMAIDNNAQLDSTPWTYFQRVYNLPVQSQQTAQLNWERFNSPADWALVQRAGATPTSDTATLKTIYSSLEKDFLQQLPMIPVWYNGAWFQGSTQHWANYPASGTANDAIPSMWRGYIGALTSIYALTSLQPAPKSS
jgi:peptide/nickel transport system substrate-binding protein